MLAYLIHNIDPFLIKFENDGPISGIRWYGVCYVISFLLVLYMLNLYTRTERSPLTRENNMSFTTYAILGVLIGGRLGYMLMYNLDVFLIHPLSIFAIWEGGMASHGGFLGALIAILIFCKRYKINALQLGDICASIAPAGLFIGRIANFINGELFGRITTVPWGIIFPQSAPNVTKLYNIPARHPSQLYEAGAEGLLLFIYVQLRFWFSKNLSKGQLSGEFLILYSIARIFTELYREPDAPLILNLSRGQFYSIFLAIIGVLLILYSKRKQRHR
ncbi:MAG: prolipoprotein diacylglyceryl transferase [Opitutales bacterium]|nr:prolipoprotein diacylglyceryl transferase [Opitutales bacterium]